jgi:deazaflavin-dependent oxidoreductase (nitroreductase family)
MASREGCDTKGPPEKPLQPPSGPLMRFYPRSRWAKALWRAPLILWRLGLGPLSGRLFLVLTVRGRKSGLPRRTMLEYYELNGVKYVTCAFGERAQYYRNILADPHVTIQTADGTESVRAVRVTDDDEFIAVYELFKRRDPPLFYAYLNALGIEPTVEDVLIHQDRIHFLRFEPTAARSLPGLEVDLAWLWPVVFLMLVALRWLKPKMLGGVDFHDRQLVAAES